MCVLCTTNHMKNVTVVVFFIQGCWIFLESEVLLSDSKYKKEKHKKLNSNLKIKTVIFRGKSFIYITSRFLRVAEN